MQAIAGLSGPDRFSKDLILCWTVKGLWPEDKLASVEQLRLSDLTCSDLDLLALDFSSISFLETCPMTLPDRQSSLQTCCSLTEQGASDVTSFGAVLNSFLLPGGLGGFPSLWCVVAVEHDKSVVLLRLFCVESAVCPGLGSELTGLIFFSRDPFLSRVGVDIKEEGEQDEDEDSRTSTKVR